MTYLIPILLALAIGISITASVQAEHWTGSLGTDAIFTISNESPVLGETITLSCTPSSDYRYEAEYLYYFFMNSEEYRYYEISHRDYNMKSIEFTLDRPGQYDFYCDFLSGHLQALERTHIQIII